MSGDAATALRERQEEGLRRLRQRFQATIVNTLDALRQLASQLADRGDADTVLDALRRELHRVHGTAGSYGYAEASRLAGAAEARAVAWSADPHLDADSRAVIVRRLIGALEQAFRDGSAADAGDEAEDGAPVILLVGVPAELAARLGGEAGARGYRMRDLPLDQAQLSQLRAIGPAIVAAPVEDAAQLSDAARDLGIPLVALETRARAQQGGAPPALGPGVALVDVRDSCAPVLDIADRARARAAGRGITVLALDDDPAILAMVAYVLEWHVAYGRVYAIQHSM